MAVLVTALALGRTIASPSDIFEIAAPALSSDAPKSTDIKDGDTTISTQTGAAQYAYPIQVPPGRHGMAPQLSISYSSQAALYGSNFGAGWTLNIPRIEEDTSGGRLRTHAPEDDYLTGANQDDLFTSSMAGGRRLVMVTTDPAAPNVAFYYRAQADASFMRYQRMDASQPFRWRVLATDGSTMYFGDTANAPGCPISDGFAPLTRHVDAFGNEVAYTYVMLDGECMLQKITWGQNANANLSAFAEVNVIFKRARLCHGVEVGSTVSYRTGTKIVSGAQQISDLVVRAFEPGTENTLHTRTVSFGYDDAAEACDDLVPALHAPIRLLTSIQESAVGVDSPLVTLPPITFTYGPTEVRLDATPPSFTPWNAQTSSGPGRNLSWGFRRIKGDDRWPTVEAMILDIDGDGLEDRLVSEPNYADPERKNPTDCRVTWQRSRRGDSGGLTQNAPPTFITWGDQGSTRMPMLRWQGAPPDQLAGSPTGYGEESDQEHREGCALNGQVTAYHNSHPAPGFCHDGTACIVDEACADGSTCPGPTGSLPPIRTYLAYRWMDADGDGLVDLVTAIHGSPHRYHPIQGNDIDPGTGTVVGYEPPLFGTVPMPSGLPACPGTTDRCKQLGSNCMGRINPSCNGLVCPLDWSDVSACVTAAPEHDCTMEIAKYAGGNPGDTPTNPGQKTSDREPFQMCNGLFPWFIFKNRGNGNFSDVPIVKYQPIPLESDSGDSSVMGPSIAAVNHGVLDLDGDGMLDGIVRARDVDQQAAAWWWFVWLNDGTGGLGPRRYVWDGRYYDHGAVNGATTAIDPNGNATSGTSMGLFDINGDGLVDHWLGLANDPNANVAYNMLPLMLGDAGRSHLMSLVDRAAA